MTLEEALRISDAQPIQRNHFKFKRHAPGHYSDYLRGVKVEIFRIQLEHSKEIVWVAYLTGEGHSDYVGNPEFSADVMGDYHFTKQDLVAWVQKRMNYIARQQVIKKYSQE